jgi:3-vinyl bacteriochlorophyllide hydratase
MAFRKVNLPDLAPIRGAVPRKAPNLSHHSVDPLSINLYSFCLWRFASPLNPRPLRTVFSMRQADGPPGSGRRTAPLYTRDERRRRDATPWTVVQGVLAPIQFLVFLVSLGLVVRYLATGDGLAIANASVVVKTLTLYAIMITGSIWEREVFGLYLFARPFFWEDVFSMLVLALHTGYLVALATGALAAQNLMLLALAAYAAYVVNATQFLLKLRAARRDACADATVEAVR